MWQQVIFYSIQLNKNVLLDSVSNYVLVSSLIIFTTCVALIWSNSANLNSKLLSKHMLNLHSLSDLTDGVFRIMFDSFVPTEQLNPSGGKQSYWSLCRGKISSCFHSLLWCFTNPQHSLLTAHLETIHRASLFPHFVMLQPYSKCNKLISFLKMLQTNTPLRESGKLLGRFLLIY